jgi:hypothetical protein
MKKVIILGITFFIIGAAGGSVAVVGWYKSKYVICECVPVSGGTKWIGGDCPSKIKKELRKKFKKCP